LLYFYVYNVDAEAGVTVCHMANITCHLQTTGSTHHGMATWQTILF